MARQTVEKTHNVAVVEKFLEAFQKWCSPDCAFTLVHMEPYLATHFHLKNNGVTYAKSAADYATACVEKYRSNYTHCKISIKHDSILTFENKVVLQFEAIFTGSQGKKRATYKMAVATLENDKIVDWQEVTSGAAS